MLENEGQSLFAVFHAIPNWLLPWQAWRTVGWIWRTGVSSSIFWQCPLTCACTEMCSSGHCSSKCWSSAHEIYGNMPKQQNVLISGKGPTLNLSSFTGKRRLYNMSEPFLSTCTICRRTLFRICMLGSVKSNFDRKDYRRLVFWAGSLPRSSRCFELSCTFFKFLGEYSTFYRQNLVRNDACVR